MTPPAEVPRAAGAPHGDGAPRAAGARLYDATALAGVITTFAAPVAALVAGASPVMAGSLGYAGILLFAGGIAARYGFAEHPLPLLQLLKNLAVAAVVTGIFYAMFLVLMLV